MPEGLVFKKNLENPNQTQFHSFLITRENGSQAFASVLTFYEQVTDLAMLSTLDALQRSFLQTRMVTLNSADNESTFDPDTDKLYAPKCLCFVTCKPVVRPCQAYLEQLHAVTAGGKQASGGLPVESFLYNILYEVPLPAPGKTTKFTGEDSTEIHIIIMHSIGLCVDLESSWGCKMVIVVVHLLAYSPFNYYAIEHFDSCIHYECIGLDHAQLNNHLTTYICWKLLSNQVH